MTVLGRVARGYDALLNFLAWCAIALIVFTMLSVIYGIVNRFVFGEAVPWVIEIVGYCLLYIVFLSTSWLLREKGHVTMDLVLVNLNKEMQRILNLITSIVGAGITLVIFLYGTKVTWQSYQTGYRFATELGSPAFVVLLIIPVGSLLLFIEFIRWVYRYSRKDVED